MNALGKHIRALIEKSGPMPIARFMEIALQDPDHGYYRRGDPLGRSGDFVTAPEVSQMFGELLGLWVAELWKISGMPAEFSLLELGPGRGTLMQDALRATAKINGFHKGMKLHVIESNQTLLSIQQEKLAGYNPHYIHSIDDLPPQPAYIIANEFFDAMPGRQFEMAADGWRERLVTVDGDEFEFVLSPTDPSFHFFIPPDRRDAPAGTIYEVSLGSLTLMRQIAKHVAGQGGAALIVDYGYAAPPGTATLQAVSGHRHADVLERPGEVDLTMHVDFAALRITAQSQAVAIHGPIGQGEFLQILGIDMRAAQLKHNATPEQAETIESALKRLTDPAQMGVLFKAMAVTPANVKQAPGF